MLLKAIEAAGWITSETLLGDEPLWREIGRFDERGHALGADLASANGTKWGLLNAVTEHVDHHMGRTDDTRLDAAWFGRGNGFKNKAFELLTAE